MRELGGSGVDTSPIRNKPVILAVDPDAEQQAFIVSSLSDRFQVIPVRTIQEAIARLPDLRPTFVLLELDAPDGDGIRFIRYLRTEVNLPAADLPLVVCVTHRGGVRDKVAALQAGASDFLVKPFTPEMLKLKIALLALGRRISSL